MFESPLALFWGLALLAVFLLLSAALARIQGQALARFGRREVLERFSEFTPKAFGVITIGLAIALLTLAAANPSLTTSEDRSARTVNAVIILDVSRSMFAEDGPGGISRLETGVRAIGKLLEAYPDGRFGLVMYTNKVQVYAPTFDHQALVIILEETLAHPDNIRGEGSDQGAALEAAAVMLEELPYQISTVILISDGGKSLSGETTPLGPALDKLRGKGVKILAVGVGDLLPVTIPVYDENGELSGYHRFRGMPAYTALEEIHLQRLADETSGWYVRLSSPDKLLQEVQARRLDNEPVATRTTQNLVWLPTAAALLLTIAALRPRLPFR